MNGLWYELSTVRWFREGFGSMGHNTRHACSAECVKAVLIDAFDEIRRDQAEIGAARAKKARQEAEEERRAREDARRVSDEKLVGEALWQLFGGL